MCSSFLNRSRSRYFCNNLVSDSSLSLANQRTRGARGFEERGDLRGKTIWSSTDNNREETRRDQTMLVNSVGNNQGACLFGRKESSCVKSSRQEQAKFRLDNRQQGAKQGATVLESAVEEIQLGSWKPSKYARVGRYKPTRCRNLSSLWLNYRQFRQFLGG